MQLSRCPPVAGARNTPGFGHMPLIELVYHRPLPLASIGVALSHTVVRSHHPQKAVESGGRSTATRVLLLPSMTSAWRVPFRGSLVAHLMMPSSLPTAPVVFFDQTAA